MRNLLLLSVLVLPTSAFAHVKWFSNYRYDQPPVGFADLNHLDFWWLFALSVATIALLVWADSRLEHWGAYRRLNERLESYSDRATLILRVATGMSLLLAWQADTVIAPDLKAPSQFAGWIQYGFALLLLGRRTTPIAGAGILALYGYAMIHYGFFHLLDYVVYAAVGYFLLVSESKNPKIRDSRVPALYLGLGFSLCWVALEKIFYPEWGLEAISKVPQITMGLEPKFFLLACAFVEFSLGYLLIICLLHRPLALTITLTFFTTTCFFGKLEVVGHTLLHGALLVFIILGAGKHYRPPIAFHRGLGWRMAFASVNFILLFALLAYPYGWLSQRTSEKLRSSSPIESVGHDDDQGHDHAH